MPRQPEKARVSHYPQLDSRIIAKQHGLTPRRFTPGFEFSTCATYQEGAEIMQVVVVVVDRSLIELTIGSLVPLRLLAPVEY